MLMILARLVCSESFCGWSLRLAPHTTAWSWEGTLDRTGQRDTNAVWVDWGRECFGGTPWFLRRMEGWMVGGRRGQVDRRAAVGVRRVTPGGRY